MSNKKTRRGTPEVNAGSMADIAFLLLIFFLVTTKIEEDKGVLVRLPEWVDDPVITETSDENVLSVLINAQDLLLIEEESAEVRDIPGLLREHVISPKRTPKQAVVSLKHDRGTNYERYLQVYDALKAGYRQLWDEAANQRHGSLYADLKPSEQKAIREVIPMIISEAEPSGHGEESK
ncbi:MAG: biopolymer transporter ExbD [Bacteroidota bacterium]